MRHNSWIRWLALAILALGLVGAMVFPGAAPVAGQDKEATPVAGEAEDVTPIPFGPKEVQPNRVSSVADTELVITGTGFVDGAAVIVEGYGALTTTFVSESMLRAALPAGVPAGVYGIRVVNPDATSALLPQALTVTAPDPTPGPTSTPKPTATPQPTAFLRPVIVVQSYGASSGEIAPGQELAFEMTLANAGQATASNVIANFVSGDFTARATGGVHAVGNLAPGQPSRFWQPLSASRDISGKNVAVLEVRVSYTDLAGTAYEETFSLTFPVVRTASGGTAPTATPTPTPSATPRLRPQLLVSSYQTDREPLEPGARFHLQMNVLNEGNADAERVTLIVGGGSGSAGVPEATPQPGGGVAGAGGEFGNFAPVGSSNVRYLGVLAQGDSLQAQVELIVNASTKPGAYPVVVAFSYDDEYGASFVDEQVVTLLVYGTPLVEINFYTEPAPLFVGQPGPLPLQLVNVGKTSTVFGNMAVTAAGVELSNNTVFVGALESGGFFPLDAMAVANEAGELELTVRVSYTDDFNQPQVISRTLAIEVQEAPPMEEPPPGEPGAGGPGDPGLPPPDQGQENWRQKLWRFVLGMIGLSSGRPDGGPQMVDPGPMEGPPVEGPGVSGPPAISVP